MAESSPKKPGRWSGIVSVAVALFVAALVLGRVAVDGVQPYGTDGAQYIEHVARLQALEYWRSFDGMNLWRLLVEADGSFPATLHFMTLPVGAALGHSARIAAATAVVWLLLLAWSVAWFARLLSGREELGRAAWVAVLLVPAFHGMATRYYYDLPMVALLWLGASCLLASLRGRWGALLAVGAGLSFLLACLVKWSALPYTGIVGLSVLLLRPPSDLPVSVARRLSSLLLAGVPIVVGVCAYLHGVDGVSSFAHQAHISLPDAQTVMLEQEGDSAGLLFFLGQVPGRLAELTGSDLLFYPLRLFTSVLSPLLGLVTVWLSWRWWRGGRPGGPALLVLLGAWAAFHLLGMSVMDDRFLVVAVPAILLLAVLGWGSLPRPVATRSAILVVSLGVLLALDFHVLQGGFWTAELPLLQGERSGGGPQSTRTFVRGVGSTGSKDLRGWARHDEVVTRGTASDRRALRQEVWEILVRCRVECVGGGRQNGALDARGDEDWWFYRGQLSSLTEADSWTVTFAPACTGSEGPPFEGCDPDYLVLSAEGTWSGLRDCVDPRDWTLAVEVPDPSGGPSVSLWHKAGSPACLSEHPE
ncbi:MAG: hypothetical protein VX498_08095 [Myxococcota bacterium]|nr:hypothetical protein [Myxococcota bacterium]